MDAVRNLLSTLLALCAAVLLTAWAPAAWLQRTVIEEKGFLAVAEPLAGQSQFQHDVAAEAVNGVLDAVSVPGYLQPYVKPALTEQAGKLTSGPVFQQIWGASMRDLHTTILQPQGGTVKADLNPYVDELVKPVGDTLGFTIRVPDTALLSLDIASIPASPWPARAQTLAGAASWLPWAGFAAALASVALAARRGVLTFVLGLALAAGGVLLLLSGSGVELLVPDAAEQARVVGPLVQAFETRLGADMVLPGVLMLGGGAACMVVALVALGIGGARRGGHTGVTPQRR